MTTLVEVPRRWVESVSKFRFSERPNQLLQNLMDRNNDGLLNEDERSTLVCLVELSEELSLISAEATRLLGQADETAPNS